MKKLSGFLSQKNMGELKSGMVIEKEVVVVKKKTWEVIRFE